MKKAAVYFYLISVAAAAAVDDAAWVVRALRVGKPPAIDGEMEEVWFRAEPASGFRQFRPALNEPALKDTEVYILYDDDALYVGWVCYEDDVGDLVACATVRDMFMNDDDCVDLMLDANNDRQSAYDFMVNWRGVRYDGAIAKDGSVGGPAWDGYWEAATSVGEDAWYCEMAIPWATLRYDRKAGYFGVQFLRFRKPTYEEMYWASDGSFINRVSTFGRVEGFENLPRPRPFELTPYVTGRGEEGFDTPGYGFEATDGWELEPRYGLDFEYRAGSAASVLVTVLPDYAYIEADPAQITLEPTEIWLEEKRPFFTEGYELFDTYSDVVYTRRLTEIAGGAKVTGRAGPINYGVLDVALKDDDPLYPRDNFALARAAYDTAGGSSFGVLGVGRREFGPEVPLEEGTGADRARYNNVGQVDGRVVLPARLGFVFEGAKSQTAGNGGDGYLYILGFGVGGLTERVDTWFAEIDDDFRADMGFLQAEDLGKREAGLDSYREFQVNRAGVRSLRAGTYYQHNWNLDGETVYNFASPSLRVVSASDYFVSVSYRGGRDLRYVSQGHPDFHNDVVEVDVGHLPASWGQASVGYWHGMWYGYVYNYYTAALTVIPTPRLVLNGNVEVGDRRPKERFVVGNLKVTHNLTDDLFWRVILQGNGDDRTSSASVLWGWDFRPGSTAYLAYEQRRDSSGHFLLAEQLAFLKVSYMIPF
ncbi:MAG: hypothetical protein GTN49_03335 [candidate division Zixibacteria bacterium]|nr:hypothetical protein [candidate division Zixibacteria bacterium]